ncbi:hypothetical protein WJX81_005712 [Elliptochloris bilobata]|uniref:Uncharacterized protein n=1 Tax=Elliptochloris bilobata TaxID=381761 RepID=A0AAW1RLX4_9CHLO
MVGVDGGANPLWQKFRAQQAALQFLSQGVQVPVHFLKAAGGSTGCAAWSAVLEQAVRSAVPPPVHANAGAAPTFLPTEAEPAWQLGARSAVPTVMAVVRRAHEESARQALKQRLGELQQLPPGLPDEARLAALLQLKRLHAAPAQRRLRAAVAAEAARVAAADPAVLADWRCWRREAPGTPDLAPPPRPLPAARLPPPPTEVAAQQAEMSRSRAVEARQRAAAAARADSNRQAAASAAAAAEDARRRAALSELQRRNRDAKMRALQERRVFCGEVAAHLREAWRPASQAAAKRRMQRCNAVRAWHGRAERRVGREVAARVAALRENDYGEYLRLTQHTKDARLRTLLGKTDSIIAELGLKVGTQRAPPPDSVAAERAAAALWADGGRQYYDSVHVIKEQVTQPAMLAGGTLRGYQLGGLRFLLSLVNNRVNGILADEMGLGKTIQTISLLATLAERKGVNGPHMILAPKAVQSNWANEFAKWAPGLKAVLYDGTPEERRAMRAEHIKPGGFNTLITHYDLALRDRSALRKVQWEVLMVDEGHRLKNAASRLAEALRGYSFRHRVLLTGTPIQNSLAELWALLNFVLPAVFDCAESFDEWFAAPFRGQGTDADDAAAQLNEEEQLLVIGRLHQVLRPFMLRRTKAEVETELPGKAEHVVRCDLSAWQRLWYRQIAEEGRVGMGGRAARSLQNAAMHLRKVCAHPYLFLEALQPPYHPEDPEELVRASGKLALLDGILPKLRATGHRVLLFSQMTRALDVVEDFLDLRGLPCLRLDGTTKAADRARLLAEYNAEGSEAFVFLLSTRAGGLGLNLQSADTVIMFDSDWNPSMDLQAEDRAHRIGQKREVLVLVLVSAGTVEEDILDRARQKRDIDAKVIQAGMFNDRSTHGERQQVLQVLLARGAASLGRGVHTPAELNELLARSPAELERFQQMDAEREERDGPGLGLLEEAELPGFVLEAARQGGGPAGAGEGFGGGEGEEADERGRRRRTRTAGSYSEAAADIALEEALGGRPDSEGDSSDSGGNGLMS